MPIPEEPRNRKNRRRETETKRLSNTEKKSIIPSNLFGELSFANTKEPRNRKIRRRETEKERERQRRTDEVIQRKRL